jgi:hypothetical protein
MIHAVSNPSTNSQNYICNAFCVHPPIVQIRGLVKRFSLNQKKGGDKKNEWSHQADCKVVFFDSRLEDQAIGGLSGNIKAAAHITHIVTGNETKRTAKVCICVCTFASMYLFMDTPSCSSISQH